MNLHSQPLQCPEGHFLIRYHERDCRIACRASTFCLCTAADGRERFEFVGDQGTACADAVSFAPHKATVAIDGLKIEKQLFESPIAKDYTPPTG